MSETPDINPSGGMPDLGGLLEAAEKMTEQMAQAQQEAAAKIITGSSGGGAVKVEMTGAMEFKSVSISPSAIDDIPMLEDLVLAAINDAVSQTGGDDMGLGGLDLGSLDLGGLGGLLGGGDE